MADAELCYRVITPVRKRGHICKDVVWLTSMEAQELIRIKAIQPAPIREAGVAIPGELSHTEGELANAEASGEMTFEVEVTGEPPHPSQPSAVLDTDIPEPPPAPAAGDFQAAQDGVPKADPSATAGAISPEDQVVLDAIAQLDPADDSHWTAAGLPDLRALRQHLPDGVSITVEGRDALSHHYRINRSRPKP